MPHEFSAFLPAGGDATLCGKLAHGVELLAGAPQPLDRGGDVGRRGEAQIIESKHKSKLSLYILSV